MNSVFYTRCVCARMWKYLFYALYTIVSGKTKSCFWTCHVISKHCYCSFFSEI